MFYRKYYILSFAKNQENMIFMLNVFTKTLFFMQYMYQDFKYNASRTHDVLSEFQTPIGIYR